jgi:succinyl-diaminopimelate desuccinylase
MSETALDPAVLAAALIRRPSVTPKDEGALDLVAAELQKLGFDCRRLAFGDIHNLYARRGDGRPNLCFSGHTDVVPAGVAEAWTFDPFSATIRNGVLCGRGAVDMKGAIAAFIAAAQRFIDERGRDFTGSISLLITGDEEGEAVNGTRKVLDWLGECGEAIDACLVGEPTSAQQLGDMIKIGRRGSMTGRLTVHGVQGHTAYPHLADNAAHRLVTMLHALTTAELDRGSEHFQPSTLQVSTIDIGNPASNVIPATAQAVFNIRFNDCWTSEKLEHWLRERLDEAGGRYALETSVSGESFLVAPGRLSDRLAEAIRRVTGRTPELSTTGGTSDARFIQAHCPVAEFGLVGQTMHKVDERVALSDLAALTAIYHTFLELFFDRSISEQQPEAVMAGLDPAIHAPDTAPVGTSVAVDHREEPGDDDCE